MHTSDLVKIINLAAIDSFTLILDKCPDLKEIMNQGNTSVDDWDVLMTAAGVGLAITVNPELDKNTAIETCHQLNPRISKALEFYLDFINNSKTLDKDLLGAQTSTWIVGNLQKTNPDYDKHIKLLSLIGHYLEHLVANK